MSEDIKIIIEEFKKKKCNLQKKNHLKIMNTISNQVK